MNEFGQLCLLGAMVGSGYAAFACVAGAWRDHRSMVRGGMFASVASVLLLTVVGAVLAWALVAADFRFAYAAQYSSQSLSWYYALSALWAGQAGSLLIWAWFLGVLALAYAFVSRREPHPIRVSAIGILMGCLCFLVTVMVFAADPMRASIGSPQTGEGLSPLLQHPVMMIHPPVIFLGYAAWAVPFALAMASLIHGRADAAWTRSARSWALGAWVVLGVGIILGGEWAYEELGWGGY
ncbi:MAG TPA: cytochrome c biogenesis protein CcsA, partial [Thermoguttaceae bacterium]|nr:cytochrome c biogenesis protein CcsA [Thermoguttaceae bacterium]